ncbi:MAG TPA: hypothetical protein VFC01_22225 [Mycobacterium sp.]|nr:hypothetical protein [Mycobacterium sp.]
MIEAISRAAVRQCFEATAQAHGVDAILVRIRSLSGLLQNVAPDFGDVAVS